MFRCAAELYYGGGLGARNDEVIQADWTSCTPISLFIIIPLFLINELVDFCLLVKDPLLPPLLLNFLHAYHSRRVKENARVHEAFYET